MHDSRQRLDVRIERHPSDGDRQFKAPRPARPRIEIEHSLVPANAGLMRMAEEDHRKFRRDWIEMQRVQIVQHVHVVILEQQHFCFRQSAALTAAIDIAANGSDRRDLFERFQNSGITDVSEMQNAFDPGECRNNLRPQQPMSIADNADFHRPRLNRRDQRLFDFGVSVSGTITGSVNWSSAPGLPGSSIAMQ